MTCSKCSSNFTNPWDNYEDLVSFVGYDDYSKQMCDSIMYHLPIQLSDELQGQTGE